MMLHKGGVRDDHVWWFWIAVKCKGRVGLDVSGGTVAVKEDT